MSNFISPLRCCQCNIYVLALSIFLPLHLMAVYQVIHNVLKLDYPLIFWNGWGCHIRFWYFPVFSPKFVVLCRHWRVTAHRHPWDCPAELVQDRGPVPSWELPAEQTHQDPTESKTPSVQPTLLLVHMSLSNTQYSRWKGFYPMIRGVFEVKKEQEMYCL